jgi:hypothetical protein
MIEGSLRIKPASGKSLLRVDIVSTRADSGQGEKELDALLEQRSRLDDRLLALATLKNFKSAAKTQGGKAPRKTKTSTDPMQAIRQGTEFAIAQLEAVYTSRRKTEQQIKRIDSRIAAAKVSGRGPETVARLYVSPANGRATSRYVLADQTWTPRYDRQQQRPVVYVRSFQQQIPRLFTAGFTVSAGRARLYPRVPDQPRTKFTDYQIFAAGSGCTYRNRSAEFIFVRAEKFGKVLPAKR